jgi:hypothetical protein
VLLLLMKVFCLQTDALKLGLSVLQAAVLVPSQRADATDLLLLLLLLQLLLLLVLLALPRPCCCCCY